MLSAAVAVAEVEVAQEVSQVALAPSMVVRQMAFVEAPVMVVVAAAVVPLISGVPACP